MRSRERYRAALRGFLEAHVSELSDDSRARLARGAVMRVLDSKDPGDQALVARGAPRLGEFWTDAARERHARVRAALEALGVASVEDPTLVRGLDYYCHTVFEFVVNDATGAQVGTVLAGGRYDGLVGTIAPPGKEPLSVPGVGWAAGMDRLMLLSTRLQAVTRAERAEVVVAAIADGLDGRVDLQRAAERQALAVADRVRARAPKGVSVVLVSGARKAKKVVADASARGAEWVLLVGEKEVADRSVVVRNLGTRSQSTKEVESVADDLRRQLVESLAPDVGDLFGR